jgi:hypothetical protein
MPLGKQEIAARTLVRGEKNIILSDARRIKSDLGGGPRP